MNPNDRRKPAGSDVLPTSADIAPADLKSPVIAPTANPDALNSWLDSHSESLAADAAQVYEGANQSSLNSFSVTLPKFIKLTVLLIVLLPATVLGLYGGYSALKHPSKPPAQGSINNTPALDVLDSSGKTLHINFDAIVNDGKTLTATGNVVVQNTVDNSSVFKIQSASGDNMFVADAKDKQINIGDKPPGDVSLNVSGDITSNGSLVSTSGYALDSRGLSIGGVLVCTSSGCVNNSGQTAPPAQNLNIANVAFLDANQKFTGNNTFTAATTFNAPVQVAGNVNSASGFSVGGTAGASFTCPAGQLLQQAVVSGGIITSGSCVVIAGGTTPTLQQVYDQSAPASITLSSSGGSLHLQDALTPLGTNLFDVSNNAGTTTYFAVNSLGISVSGNVNTSGQYQVGGVQISSADLSDSASITKKGNTFNGANQLVQLTAGGILPVLSGANLTNLNASNVSAGTLSDTRLSTNVALLNGTQTFTGANTFNNLSNSFAGSGSGLTNLNATNVSSGTLNDLRLSSNVTLDNGNNTFTGNNSFHLSSAALSVQDAASPLGTDLFEVTDNAGTTKYLAVSATGVTINGNDVCTAAGNCTGVSGGAIGGSGTAGKIAKFTGSGFTIGDSLISDNGTTVSVGGNINTTGQYQVNGSQISSANLSDGNNLALLNAIQTFTGANTFSSASNSFSGNGSGLTNVNAAQLNGQGSSYYTNATNISTGTLSDSRLSTNVALLNANQTFTGNNIFALSTAGLAVQDAASPLGTNLFEVTDNTGTTKYFTVSATALQFNGNDVCTAAGNCTGVSGGAIGGSGTAGKLAKFTGSGFTVGDSLLSDNGTTVTVGGVLGVNTITPTATLTIGAATQTLALQGDSSTYLSATSGSFTNKLAFSAPAVASHTITLPNASGTVAVSASGPLALDAAGNLTCPTCLTSGGGGGTAGVNSVNTFTGDITLAGTTDQVIITPNAGTLTFSLPQSINTTSSPQFTNINVTGQYQVNGSQISSSNLSDGSNLAKLNGTQTFTGANTFNNASNSFTGDGSGLSNVDAAQLNGQAGSYYTNATNISTGTLADGRLSSNVALLNRTGQVFTGDNTIKTDSGGAFVVQNSTGSQTVLDVDTTSGRLGVGTATPTEKITLANGNIGFTNDADPTTAPTVAINAAAGNLNGSYVYMVTFVTPAGETAPGPGSLSVSPVNQQVDLTNIPVGGARVTARNIYRLKLVGGSPPWNLVATINDNVTTTYTDNLADGSVGAAATFINSTGGFITLNGSKVLVAGQTTLLGYQAGAVNAAADNSFIGYQSGMANTTGAGNTAVGYQSLQSNTTGGLLAAFGTWSLQLNTTGVNNSGFGFGTLAKNTTGSSNVAVGTDAVNLNTTGSNNTGVGSFSLSVNTTGVNNTGLGAGSLQSATTANQNTGIGTGSGQRITTGSNNTGIGYVSLNRVTTGSGNTALGYDALDSVTTGTNNTAVGYLSNVSGSNLTNATAIGANAVVSASNSLVLGGTGANAVKVGIGTATPGHVLDVQGDASFKNLTNSTTAFQIQNASGTQLVNLNTVTSATNLITNPGFEVDTSGWTPRNSSTVSRTTSVSYMGAAAGQIDSGGNLGAGIIYSYTFLPDTTYTFSIYAEANGASFSANLGWLETGATGNNCATSYTITSSGWTRMICTFTTGATISGSYVFAKQTDSVVRSWYVDSGRLEQSFSASAQSIATLTLNAAINSPTVFQNATDSSTAFQIQNAAGTSSLLVADTLQNAIGIGGAPTSSAPLQVFNGSQSVALGTTPGGGIGMNFNNVNSTKSTFIHLLSSASGGLGFCASTNTTACSVGQDQIQLAAGGAALFRNTSDSNAAFQVQNSTASTLFNVDTSEGYVINNGTSMPGNELQNPGFEASGTTTASGWAFTGTSTTATDANARSGNRVAIITANGNYNANTSVKTFAVTAGVTYDLQAWVKSAAGTNGQAVVAINWIDKTGTTFGQTYNTVNPSTTYSMVEVTATPMTNAVAAQIYFGTSLPSTTGTWYFDDFQFVRATNTAPAIFENSANSTTAFQVQNASGASLLTGDTSNMRISIGSLGTATGGLYVGGKIATAATSTTATLGTAPTDVKVRGHYAYVLNNTGSNAFQVFDVTNPSAPVSVGSTVINAGRHMVLSGNYAYVVSFASSTLQIIDISNPSSPSIVSTTTLLGAGGQDVAVSGQYAYVVTYTGNTLETYDISNPSVPRAVNTLTTAASNYRIAIQGKYAFVTNNAGKLASYSLANPSQPVLASAGAGAGTIPNSLYIQGRYAYVAAANTAAFAAIDISNPASPVAASSTNAVNEGYEVVAQNRYAYVISNSANTLQILDITQPVIGENVIGTISTGSAPSGLAVVGRYAYVVDASGLQVFDLGGAYIQQLEAGGAEFGTLNVDNDANFSGDVSVRGGLNVGSGGIQTPGNLGVNGNTTLQGYTYLSGGSNRLDITTGIGVARTNCSGSTSYFYSIAAVAANGGQTGYPGFSWGNTNYCATLNSTSYLTISWSAVSGAVAYKVYRTTSTGTPSSTGYIGTTTGLSLVDNGLVADNQPEPIIDTSGQLAVSGASLFQTPTNTSNALTVQNATGLPILNVDTNYSTINVNSSLGNRNSTLTQNAPSTSTTGGTLAAATYYYKITAIDGVGGESTPTAEKSITTTGTTSTVTLSWVPWFGTAGYKIYRSTSTGTEVYLTTTYGTVNGANLNFTDTGSITPGTATPPAASTFKYNGFSSSNNKPLQLDVGGMGVATGQVYVGGIVPLVTGSSKAGLNNPNSVYVVGKYAYVASTTNNSLVVYDISSPNVPTLVGSSNNGLTSPVSVYVQGKYAYVYGSGKLSIFDITNPSAPTLAGSTTAGLSGGGLVVVQGRYAYVGSIGNNYLRIFDISNPAAPAAMSGIGSIAGGPFSLYLQGNYVYVGNGNGQLLVVNISNPASPSLASTTTLGSATDVISAVSVQGKYAYATDLSNNTFYGLDVSNPAAPVVVGSNTSNLSAPDGISIQGRYAFVVNQTNNNLAIVDITNPSYLNTVWFVSSSLSAPTSVSVQGRYAYVTSYSNSSLVVFDLGGTYSQQLEAGGAEFGTLQVDTNGQVAGDFNIQGGLSVGQNLQAAGNVGIGGGLNAQGSVVLGGGVNSLAKPSFTDNQTNCTGTTSWFYQVTAVNATGGETPPAGAIGNSFWCATLDATHFVTISWSAVPGATAYKVYRSTAGGTPSSTGLIGTTTSLSLVDNGLVAGGPIAPTVDTSGQLTVQGSSLFQNKVDSTTAFQIQNAAGTSNLFVADTTNSLIGIGTNAPTARVDIEASPAGSNNAILYVAGTSASTAGQIGTNSFLTVTPGSASTSTYTGISSLASAANGNSSGATVIGVHGEGRATNGGVIGTLIGGQFNVDAINFGGGGGTITNGIGLQVANGLVSGAGTSISSAAGIDIDNQTVATNNTNLLIGTKTIPTGNYSIYNSSTYNNYLAGALGIGTASPQAQFHLSIDGNTPVSSLLYTPTGGLISNSGALTTLQLLNASNNATDKSQFAAVRARGTVNSPLALQNGDSVFSFQGSGYDGSARQNAAAIDFTVDNTVSSGNVPIGIGFATGTSGANRTTVATISSIGAANFKNRVDSTAAFQVQNSTNGSLLNIDTQKSNITLNGLNSGELSAWQSGTNTVPARGSQSTVYANGYAYMIGGLDAAGTAHRDTYYAKVNADGTVGTWTLSPNQLPSATGVYGLASVAANGYIYAIGGSDNSTGAIKTVSYARLNSDGSIGAWKTTSDLPAIRWLPSAATYNGYIFVMGGADSTPTAQSTVYSGKINADGTISSWTTLTATPLTGPRYEHTSVVANGYVYVIGGLDGAGATSSSVYFAKLNNDGTLGAWSTSAATGLPVRAGASSAAANGYIYVFGGVDATTTNGQNTVYYSRIGSNGVIGNWTLSGSTLPDVRDNTSSFSANGYMYALDGFQTNFATAQATTYYASTSRIQLGGSIDLVGLSGGDLSVNNGGGGSLTAGNTQVVGSLMVQGQTSLSSSLNVAGNINANAQVLFQNSSDSTIALQVQNSAGSNVLSVDTSDRFVSIGSTAASTSLQVSRDTSTLAADWQPIVSGNASRKGTYSVITQPTNVTGVLALLPTTNISAAGAGTLSWNFTNKTLTWKSGTAVTVSTTANASYLLPDGSGGSILAVVTAASLPGANQSDSLTITTSVASAGFGDNGRNTARGSAIFNGNIYLGTENDTTDMGEVWRSADGINWVKAAQDSFGQGITIDHVDSFIVYNGYLYAGTDIGQIWRTQDGSLWTRATLTPGATQNITDFTIFGGYLYANQANTPGNGAVYRTVDGVNWTNVFTYSQSQQKYTHDLAVFQGRLYSDVGSYKGNLGAGPGAIYSSTNGTSWTQSGTDGFGNNNNTDISALTSFNGYLYAGTFNATNGAEIWRTADGVTWQKVVTGGFGSTNVKVVHKFVVYNNYIYASTEDDTDGGRIYRSTDGLNWSLVNNSGFGVTGEAMRMRSMFIYNGFLYANAENDSSAKGFEIWRLQTGTIAATTGGLYAQSLQVGNVSLSDQLTGLIGLQSQNGTFSNLNVTSSLNVGGSVAVSSTSATAFQVQNSAASALLVADTSGMQITINGNLALNGHIITGNRSGSTTAAAGANAGTGATVTITGNDTSGKIVITTGTGAAVGDLADVTFANAFGSVPNVVLSAGGTNAALLQQFVSPTVNGFSINAPTGGAGLASTTTYTFYYHVMQ